MTLVKCPINSLVAQKVKDLPAMQETWIWSLGGEDRSPGEGNGNPLLQYSCPENSMERGAWWDTVYEWVSEVAQSCPTLCDPMDCNLPGSFIHGIFPGKNTGVGAISFCRRSSWLRGWTWVSHIVGRRFTIWATREVQTESMGSPQSQT